MYRGKKYDGCVPSSKDGKGPWCATKVDSNGNMRKDKWARCNKHCHKDDGKYFAITLLTYIILILSIYETMQFIKIQGLHMTCKAKGQEKDYNSGKGKVQDCVFPFIHNGQKFAGCASSKDGMGNYCATKVDSNGILVGNNWARCNKYCKHDVECRYQLILYKI